VGYKNGGTHAAVKAFLVAKNPPTTLPEGVKVVLPFVEEDVLYIFDERFSFLEITGREKSASLLPREARGEALNRGKECL